MKEKEMKQRKEENKKMRILKKRKGKKISKLKNR